MKTVKQQFITDEKGEKIAVVISMIYFNQMQEDLHDLGVIAQRKKEPTVPYQMVKEKFKKS